MRLSSLLSTSAAGVLAPFAALAQEAGINTVVTTTTTSEWGLVAAVSGVALATILACIGSILGVSIVGQAGAGLVTEKPNLAGKVITLAVLPGSQGLYGMVISLLFIFNYSTLLGGTDTITTTQGWAVFLACMPVAFTCLTSAPFQAKVCSAGMNMLAKDDKLAGRVITMAALVETYALLGFLISFFLLNNLRAGIIVG